MSLHISTTGGLKWISRLHHQQDLGLVEFVDLIDAYVAHLMDCPEHVHSHEPVGDEWIKHHQRLRNELHLRTGILK